MWHVATIGAVNPVIVTAGKILQMSPDAPGQMDQVMLLGFLASFFTVVFFIYRLESRAMLLLLALSIAAMALYGALRGVWPLAVSESLWSFVAFRSWLLKKTSLDRDLSPKPLNHRRTIAGSDDGSTAMQWDPHSRISRMFGAN
jgi:hypothetical protein